MNEIECKVKVLGDFCKNCMDLCPVESVCEFAGDEIVSRSFECSNIHMCRRLIRFLRENNEWQER